MWNNNALSIIRLILNCKLHIANNLHFVMMASPILKGYEIWFIDKNTMCFYFRYLKRGEIPVSQWKKMFPLHKFREWLKKWIESKVNFWVRFFHRLICDAMYNSWKNFVFFLLYCLHIISMNVFHVETGKQTIHKKIQICINFSHWTWRHSAH